MFTRRTPWARLDWDWRTEQQRCAPRFPQKL